MSAAFAVGDIVRVGKGTARWTVTALHGEHATLRTGVGRLGRNGRTTVAPIARLTKAFA